MSGYTLTYDDWATAGERWFPDRADALTWAKMMDAEKLVGKPAYARITVTCDATGRVIFDKDNA